VRVLICFVENNQILVAEISNIWTDNLVSMNLRSTERRGVDDELSPTASSNPYF
jgi:hypothetical protein